MRRLLVSFIGHQDINNLKNPADSADQSPIIRFLLFLIEHPQRPADTRVLTTNFLRPADTRVLLFDDHPENSERKNFRTQLEARLPEFGLADMPIDLISLALAGPTDRDGLYTQIWEALRPSKQPEIEEYVFHLTPGTPAMQATLMLAACCLPLPGEPRLIETSRKGGENVQLPYLLALRANQQRERQQSKLKLCNKIRKTLMPNTVVGDSLVEHAYAALHKAATTKKPRQLVLISGPTGTGKWHAARQFAHWRGGEHIECYGPAELKGVSPDASGTVLLYRLDRWKGDELGDLAAWCEKNRQATVAATWRTDWEAAASLDAVLRDGLRGAAQVHLPALASRSDIAELAEAMATQMGILTGKMYERFQYEYLSDNYPRNLHDLATLLATIDAHSGSAHPGADGLQCLRQMRKADAARVELRDALDSLNNLDFGPGKPSLSDRLIAIRCAVTCCVSPGRTQLEIGNLLGKGNSQQTVSKMKLQKKQ